MSGPLGQGVIIENVVGGGSTLANDRVARSAPDGSTILINHVALLAAPSLFVNLRYDTRTAFEPVGLVNNAPMVLIGRKTIPGAGPKDFVAWIKAQGDKANFAPGGIGTNSHLCAVMMGNVLGFNIIKWEEQRVDKAGRLVSFYYYECAVTYTNDTTREKFLLQQTGGATRILSHEVQTNRAQLHRVQPPDLKVAYRYTGESD